MAGERSERLSYDVLKETAGADFGDRRLTRRMVDIISALERNPDASFPAAMVTTAALEGLYRFLANERVTPEKVLAPHAAATVARAREVRRVVAIHDTTEMSPPSADAEGGFYALQEKRWGFLAHFTMLVAADEPVPLGVTSCSVVARNPHAKQGHWRERWRAEGKESRRWARGAIDLSKQLGPDVEIVHVMDREADSYEIFHDLASRNLQFVIRLTHDRKVLKDSLRTPISGVVASRPVVLEREVRLSARKRSGTPQKDRKHPPRVTRMARLEARAAAVTLLRPPGLPVDLLPAELRVNVVTVTEAGAPDAVEPVEWNLVTQLPIDTPEQVAAVIDRYRGRWLIEEFFKALKTGCAVEQRALESMKTSSVALALFVPLGVQLLLLRHLSRAHPTALATTVFTSDEVAAVRRLAASDRRLPPRASVRHVMLAIAGLGGHQKSNGEPGWQVLGRGYLRLCEHIALAATMDDVAPSKTQHRRGASTM